jgi:uncharacterized protein
MDPRRAELRAVGTLDRPTLSATYRWWLYAELLIVFAGAPLIMRVLVFDYKVPVFLALPPVLIAMMAFLLFDRTFSLKQELRQAIAGRDAVSIVAIFVCGAAAVAWAVSTVMPERFLALPRQRPDTWLKIIALYPFTSVLAQEFVYRTFFFHRYGRFFGGQAWLLILINAAAFAVSHIIFRNWIAVGGTFVIGLLLAWRYHAARSFWTVWFEHVLWGYLVFTVGLGVFFFTGNRNPMW